MASTRSCFGVRFNADQPRFGVGECLAQGFADDRGGRVSAERTSGSKPVCAHQMRVGTPAEPSEVEATIDRPQRVGILGKHPAECRAEVHAAAHA